MHELFSKSGDVKRIIIGLDKVKKTACGFCFVEYPLFQYMSSESDARIMRVLCYSMRCSCYESLKSLCQSLTPGEPDITREPGQKMPCASLMARGSMIGSSEQTGMLVSRRDGSTVVANLGVR